MSDTTQKLAIAAAGAAAGALLAWKIATRPYKVDKVWQVPKGGSGGKWAKINSHTSGAREEKALDKGKHDIQLYSLGTPNGVKVTILLEELCEILPDFDYDAWLLMIDGAQFGSEFVDVNPNSKIPALLDQSKRRPTTGVSSERDRRPRERVGPTARASLSPAPSSYTSARSTTPRAGSSPSPAKLARNA